MAWRHMAPGHQQPSWWHKSICTFQVFLKVMKCVLWFHRLLSVYDAGQPACCKPATIMLYQQKPFTLLHTFGSHYSNTGGIKHLISPANLMLQVHNLTRFHEPISAIIYILVYSYRSIYTVPEFKGLQQYVSSEKALHTLQFLPLRASHGMYFAGLDISYRPMESPGQVIKI